MGSSQSTMERDQELRMLGVALCIEVGALNQCEKHEGEYFDGGNDVVDAYKLANSRINKGEIELESGEVRETLTKAIKGVYDEYAHTSRCSACEAIRRKD